MKLAALLKACAVLITLALAAPLALAANDGWHVVAVATGTSQSLKDSRFTGATDECDMGWILGGGYAFDRHWVVELTFEDLGETEFDGFFDYDPGDTGDTGGTGTGIPMGVTDVGTIEIEAIVASVLYDVPLGDRLSFFGRAGVAFYDAEENEVFGGVPERNTASGEAPLIGVGLGWELGERWGLRLDLRHYFDVGERDKTGDGDVDTAGIGAVLRF